MESFEYYMRRKHHYKDDSVVREYERKRFFGLFGKLRHKRDVSALRRAIRYACSLSSPIKSILDIPCGTGRMFELFSSEGISFVGADISLAMIVEAMRKPNKDCMLALVVCDAEAIPFKDDVFDAVVCIRFMFHVPRDVQLRILREMRRVSKRWVIVEFRHRYTIRYMLLCLRYKLGLLKQLKYRFSKSDLTELAHEAGLTIRGIFSTRPYAPFLSDKWVVLLEKV
ncbi:MAG: hypothetical protein RUDDFDWM_001310 [Candidatus Fervidibacterota bacterium]